MDNTYLILDTAHALYQERIDSLAAAHTAKGVNFVPVLNLDSSKALIQIKSAAAVEVPTWAKKDESGVSDYPEIGQNHEAWAQSKVVNVPEWQRIDDPV